VRDGVPDGLCLGLAAPRNVINSDSILQDLGANESSARNVRMVSVRLRSGYHRLTKKKCPSRRAESASIVR
jgi:hypothetical protein